MTAINVAGLLRDSPGVTREVRLRDRYLSLGPEIELAGPVDAQLRLQRTNRGILLRGWAETSVRRTCARCLDPIVERVKVQLSEEYLPSVDPTTGAPLDEGSDEVDTLRISDHHEIDLDPALREELILAEPMHPLCRPDCAGLCPGCGRRMDVGSCDCVVVTGDPRLAALGQLLEARRRAD